MTRSRRSLALTVCLASPLTLVACASEPEVTPNQAPPNPRAVELPAEVQITRITLSTAIELVAATHKTTLELQARIQSEPTEPPLAVELMPVIEACILSDGSDITMLHESNAPGQRARRYFNDAGSWPRQVGDATLMSTTKFLNLPPKPYSSIRRLTGYFDAVWPTRVDAARIDYANDSVVTTEQGWRIEVLGIPDAESSSGSTSNSSNGRITITRDDISTIDPFKAPRLVRLEFLNDTNEVMRTPSPATAKISPTGITVDLPGMTSRPRADAPLRRPAAIRIEFVSESEPIRIPFEYHDIPLTR